MAAERLIYSDKVKMMFCNSWPSVSVIMPLVETNKVVLFVSSAGPLKLPNYMFRSTPDWARLFGCGTDGIHIEVSTQHQEHLHCGDGQ